MRIGSAGALLVALVALLSAALLPACRGSGDSPEKAAHREQAAAAARAWLGLMDGGGYEAALASSAGLFRQQLDEARWRALAEATRAPLGAVVERRQIAADHRTRLPGAPDGTYVVIQFATRFANKAEAVETITPMLEKDGVWRVSGYYIR